MWLVITDYTTTSNLLNMLCQNLLTAALTYRFSKGVFPTRRVDVS